MYIAKNNEIRQEFFFAHPRTKIWVNNVYNTSLYSSPLWDIHSKEFEKLEKTWNVSQRLMLDTPRTTHKYFIEPLSKTQHISKSLKKRFINFVNKVRTSRKNFLRRVLYEIETDCRSITGRNIRKMLLSNDVLRLQDIDTNLIPYNTIPEGQEWKIELVMKSSTWKPE